MLQTRNTPIKDIAWDRVYHKALDQVGYILITKLRIELRSLTILAIDSTKFEILYKTEKEYSDND